MKNTPWKSWLGAAISAGLLGVGGVYAGRRLVDRMVSQATKRIMKDPYHENLWEFVSASTRIGLQNIVETNLRAEEGKAIDRPLGSPRKFMNFDSLTFNIAQLATFPTPREIPVEMGVVIGPRARYPMTIELPILIAGMAYGFALTERAKIALAIGARMAGTATNSGEGPFLEAERKAAGKFVLQYNRGTWNKTREVLKQADMIEIQLGQGAIAGVSHTWGKGLGEEAQVRRLLHLGKNEEAVTNARMPGLETARDLRRLVENLRQETGGVPIGVKMGAGHQIEADMAIAAEAGVDAIIIDGAQAATYGSPPILQDDFGLPSLYALPRAARFMDQYGLRGEISLIASGGFFTPGDFLKGLALGADAIAIGTVALFAMSHTQVLKALPFEPPTQVVWAQGSKAKAFNPQKAGKTLHKYFMSCADEMADAIRAMGKLSVHQVNADDLAALDPLTAEITGCRMAWEPQSLLDPATT